MIFNDFLVFFVIFNDFWWFSMIFNDFQWFSLKKWKNIRISFFLLKNWKIWKNRAPEAMAAQDQKNHDFWDNYFSWLQLRPPLFQLRMVVFQLRMVLFQLRGVLHKRKFKAQRASKIWQMHRKISQRNIEK